MESAYKNPEQDAATSNAGTLPQANFLWTMQAVDGKAMSGEVVETRMASTALA
jgi:hypothetical protein